MRVEISGEDYSRAVKDFLKIYYKEELKHGSLRRTIKTYAICLLILIIFCIAFKGLKDIFLMVIYFLIGMIMLISGFILLTIFINNKKKDKINIDKVEQVFNDKIYINAYLKSGGIESTQYNYSDLKKVVEGKESFYLFLNDSLALPVIKKGIDREEFIKLMFEKNIVVKEDKKNGIH